MLLTYYDLRRRMSLRKMAAKYSEQQSLSRVLCIVSTKLSTFALKLQFHGMRRWRQVTQARNRGLWLRSAYRAYADLNPGLVITTVSRYHYAGRRGVYPYLPMA